MTELRLLVLVSMWNARKVERALDAYCFARALTCSVERVGFWRPVLRVAVKVPRVLADGVLKEIGEILGSEVA